jgi:hypothetical protein
MGHHLGQEMDQVNDPSLTPAKHTLYLWRVGPVEDKKESEMKEQAIEEQKPGTGSLLDPLCCISSSPRLSNPYLLLVESPCIRPINTLRVL